MKLAEAIRQRIAAEAPGSFEVGRTLHSKTFDIGGGRRRVIQRMAPLHWRANLADGTETWKEIDLTITQGAGGQYRVVSGFYAVLIDPTQVSYRYATNRASGVTVVTLAEVGGAAPAYGAMTVEVEGNRFTWRNVAPGVDMYLVCRPRYAELFKVVRDAGAARSFGWQVTEDNDDDPKRAARFVRETAGWDADRSPLEMTTAVSNQRVLAGGRRRRFLYRETWTGRVSRVTDRATRQRGWFDDPAYPAIIDATVTENIGAGADDGFEYSGSWHPTNNVVIIGRGYDGAIEHGGFRFQTVDVPQGATVSAATLTIKVFTIHGTPTASIYGDDVDDAPAWGASSRPSSGFTKTTAKTNITSAIGTGLEAIDVTAIVQEIVDRAGWTNNNNIRFGAFNTKVSGSYEDFYVEAYENVGTDEAQLDITYTGGGGGGTTATPGATSLATATFAPTVTATANRVATAGVAALGLTGYAPTVTVSDHKTATPAALALATTAYAPVPAATANVTATPDPPSLATTAYAPVPAATAHVTATPGQSALALTGLAPTVTTPVVATPPVATLALTAYAPTAEATANRVATPGVASLATTGYAPTASVSGNQTATPAVAGLVLSGLAPVPAVSDNQAATPGALALVTTAFAPGVTATAHQVATPDPLALVTTGPAPVVTASDHQVATPGPLAMATTAYAPAATATANQVATPGVLAVALAGYAPAIATPVASTPATATLATTGFSPAITTTALATPGTLALTLAAYAPAIVTPVTVTPDVLALSLTGYAPALTVAQRLYRNARMAAGAVAGGPRMQGGAARGPARRSEATGTYGNGFYGTGTYGIPARGSPVLPGGLVTGGAKTPGGHTI